MYHIHGICLRQTILMGVSQYDTIQMREIRSRILFLLRIIDVNEFGSDAHNIWAAFANLSTRINPSSLAAVVSAIRSPHISGHPATSQAQAKSRLPENETDWSWHCIIADSLYYRHTSLYKWPVRS